MRKERHGREENSGQPDDYVCFQRAMIATWQQLFAAYGGAAHTPFVFVQLQPCGIPPEMRYAQATSLTIHSGLPAVGMAVCYDLGDPDPTNPMGLCHSRYKLECGRRLAISLMSLLPSNLGKLPSTATATYVSSLAAGPAIQNVTLLDGGTIVELQVANGRGMIWRGTKQCTRCCGYAGWKRDGKGTTNGYIMTMLLEFGTWSYITAESISFPDANTTSSKIHIRVPSPLTPRKTPYCPALELRYAWEDFPECAIFNEAGLPMAPFNVTIPQISV